MLPLFVFDTLTTRKNNKTTHKGKKIMNISAKEKGIKELKNARLARAGKDIWLIKEAKASNSMQKKYIIALNMVNAKIIKHQIGTQSLIFPHKFLIVKIVPY